MKRQHRIQRINQFLEDYKTLSPSLQNLCSGSIPYFKNELIRELVNIGKHPYPNEALGFEDRKDH